MSAMHKQDAPAPTIEHIMSAISGLEASQDEPREMITAAIAEARRDGAEQMREACNALREARAMGLQIGDTIEGKQHTHTARLTLLWLD
jgi:hypothetical protein